MGSTLTRIVVVGALDPMLRRSMTEEVRVARSRAIGGDAPGVGMQAIRAHWMKNGQGIKEYLYLEGLSSSWFPNTP
jgi:hypothetical protein